VISIIGAMAILTDPARYQKNAASAPNAGANGKKKVHFKE
jgi:hypothetical protein